MTPLKVDPTNKKLLRKIIRLPFKYYRKKILYKEEFFQFFKDQGWSDDEIDELWFLAIAKSGIVNFWFIPEADDFPPKEIRDRMVIELVESDLCKE